MAPHSSTLAWEIPWMEEPGGLPSMGLHSQTRLKRLSGSSSDYAFLPYCETGEGKLLPPSKDSQVVGYYAANRTLGNVHCFDA